MEILKVVRKCVWVLVVLMVVGLFLGCGDLSYRNSDFWKLKEAGEIDKDAVYELRNVEYCGPTSGLGVWWVFRDYLNGESMRFPYDPDQEYKFRRLTRDARYNIRFVYSESNFCSRLLRAERVWGDE